MDTIQDILLRHVGDRNSSFVFSTELAADSWEDFLVLHPELSGTTVVERDRFFAWDSFKAKKLKLEVRGYDSVPSIMRKLFARAFIVECCSSCAAGKPLVRTLIPPRFSARPKDVLSFTDWIASMLPSLKLWHEKHTAYMKKPGAHSDDIDADYETLYQKYCAFLEEKKFFEPSWVDRSELEQCVRNLDRDYYIFYPEVFEDWDTYAPYLNPAMNPRVHLVQMGGEESLPAELRNPEVLYFSNARTELRYVALKIRELVASGASWTEISIVVPDIETWRPYLERELDLYRIPYVVRAAKTLSAGVGRIFREIHECYEHNFSYDSVRSLLLDKTLPWRNFSVNQSLLEAGQAGRCICNPEDGVDYWEQALKLKGGNSEEKALYASLKKCIVKMCNARNFSEVKDAWIMFRDGAHGSGSYGHLEKERFNQRDNLLMGKCIDELNSLIELEEKYSIVCENAFSFYLSVIDSTVYQEQLSASGVSVFGYKVSASSAYKYQFVMNANQKDMTVPNKELLFLSAAKKRELGIVESSLASDTYVRLYAMGQNTVFTCAKESFTGFLIPYNILEKRPLYSGTSPTTLEDYLVAERAGVPAGDFVTICREALCGGNAKVCSVTSDWQCNAFDKWRSAHKTDDSAYKASLPTMNAALRGVKAELNTDGSVPHASPENPEPYPGMVHISQSALVKTVPCRRAWLYDYALGIKGTNFDASLSDYLDFGSILHSLLEQFMLWCRQNTARDSRLPVVNEEGRLCFWTKNAGGTVAVDAEEEIAGVLNDKDGGFFTAALEDKSLSFYWSPLVKKILYRQREGFCSIVLNFLRTFCLPEHAGGAEVVDVEHFGYAEDSSSKDYVYYGSIDLVLKKEGKDICIVDYKTKNVHGQYLIDPLSEEKGKGLSNFQMAIYTRIWNEEEPRQKVNAASFYTIAAPKAVPVFDSANQEISDLFSQTVKTVDEYFAKEFSRMVREGDFVPDPQKVRPYENCIECEYCSVCRTTYTAAGESL